MLALSAAHSWDSVPHHTRKMPGKHPKNARKASGVWTRVEVYSPRDQADGGASMARTEPLHGSAACGGWGLRVGLV